tara:strand:- start:569 stop:1165 length:597 start_codon:yes stop_codon:yes gene_type:complete
MIKFRHSNCEKCGCELNEKTRYVKCADNKTGRMASSRFCITHKLESMIAIRNKSYHKRKPARKTKEIKYCSAEDCGILITPQNSRATPYTTKEGVFKISLPRKCRSCSNRDNRVKAGKRVVKKEVKKVVKVEVKKVVKVEVKVEVSEANDYRKMTTKEKMMLIFQGQKDRTNKTAREEREDKIARKKDDIFKLPEGEM